MYTGTPQDGTAYGNGEISSFMQDFLAMGLAYMQQVQALDSNTDVNTVIEHFGRYQIGRLGPNGADNFCFEDATHYSPKVSATNLRDPLVSPFGDWWGGAGAFGDMYEASLGVENTSCGKTLNGNPNKTSHPDYWLQLLAPVALLVDMEAEGLTGLSGAAAGLARVNGATNAPEWAVCDKCPLFCGEPRP